MLLFAQINSIGVNSAHIYPDVPGSPDADFDLRGAHLLPLEIVIGLEANDETVEVMDRGRMLPWPEAVEASPRWNLSTHW